ncbi:MAG: molybdopterin-dependent oxidoreductase [Nitrospinae bacterium]|nr:molybdopterin-dependent oxidoreductase [Nitrospinota bacterium]
MLQVKSVCRSCHGGCGVIVHVKDGAVEKIKGDPSSPISRGWLCVKGVHSAEMANHPARLKTPLKRSGARGEGKWKQVSWETALDEIADRLGRIKGQWGAESLAIGQGTGRHHYMHTVRFANALGTPNWYEPGLAQCFIPRITVSNMTYGGFVTPDYYGATKPAMIIFWAHNPLVTSADGELAPAVQRGMGDGCVTVAIDPQRSETGKKCGTWLAVRPGTDAALALAMIHVIIRDKLHDAQFVSKWCSGFDELCGRVADMTPEWAEKITGVSAEDIAKVATAYATIKPGVIEWGLGIEQNANSLQTVRAIAILRAITGNLDVPGGDLLGMNILNPYPTLKDKLPKQTAQKRIGGETFKLLGGWRAYMPSAHIPGLFNAMRTGNPYPVKSLMLFGNNPMATVANTRGVYDALMKLELLVTTDLFMTPSAALSDYVLPAAFWTEIEHLNGMPLVAETFAYAHPKITQTGEAMQDEWIMDELMKRLDLPGCGMTYRQIFDHQLAPTGMTFNELVKNGPYLAPAIKYRKYEEKGFRTPSRKVELSCPALKRMGYDHLPFYEEPPESPEASPDVAASYPLILVTGARTREFFHSDGRQVESLRKQHPDPLARMSPQAAAARGITDGDWVIIASPRGEIRMKAAVTDDIRPDVVNVEHGWWFPELADDPLGGIFESNANILTTDQPPYDPAFGACRLRGLLCEVRKE